MEICVLKFDDTHEAEDDLGPKLEQYGDSEPWIHEVAVVSRPLVGRIKISGTFLDHSLKYREGDLTKAAGDVGAYTGYVVSNFFGPLLSPLAALEGQAETEDVAADLEEDLFRFEDVKGKLPRGSSALVLVADPEICDRFEAMFRDNEPEVVRRELEPELRKRFDQIHQRVVQMLKERAAQEEPAPPPTM
jgi:hypothetical protein